MVLLRITRLAPSMRGAMRARHVMAGSHGAPLAAPTCTRCFSRGPFGRDPFSQMEDFMKDVERKFKRDVEGTITNVFRDFPRVGSPSSIVPRAEPAFGHMENVSTEHMYKLSFNLANAKPEDVKVILKGRNLSVSSHAVTETETSKSSFSVTREYLLPEDVELEALESSLSPEGLLMVEAPRTGTKDTQAPQSIHISREAE